MEKLFEYESKKDFYYENGYFITSNINRMGKLLAQYELYKEIIDLPGEVMEFGVHKGASLIRLATYREILESQHSRKIIGFDMFDRFPRVDDEIDNEFIDRFEKEAGTAINKDELEKIFKYKNFINYELIKGDILETLPDYIEKNKHLKIALLHIDVDVYKPTYAVLNTIFDRVVRGGIIMFDDYAKVHGANRVIDKFFEEREYEVKKLSISHTPSYIVK